MKLTLTLPLPATTAPMVGAPGTVAGVMLFDAAEGKPEPTKLEATTLNVYTVPFISPATVRGLAVPLAVNPPGVDVAVKPVTGLPPLLAGAVKLTVAL